MKFQLLCPNCGEQFSSRGDVDDSTNACEIDNPVCPQCDYDDPEIIGEEHS
jgi:hypothetical protein